MTMKKILTIIFAALAFAACNPDEKTAEFKADVLPGTKWEGTYQSMQGNVVTGTSTVTLKFNDGQSGQMIQKRSNSSSKDYYDMSYSVSGKKISIDCPVINGTWEVSGYTDKTMVLTLLPDKNGIMTLVLQ